MGEQFEPNGYDEMYATYFEDLVANGSVAADPSGWSRTEPGAGIGLDVPMPTNLLAHYVVDNRQLIAPEKERLKQLLSEWDVRTYMLNEITLTPSISTACLATLLVLHSVGIRRIVFETPAYYATIDQACALGFDTELIPTHAIDGYGWSLSDWMTEKRKGSALWLTQPRYALGQNQMIDHVAALFAELGKDGFLVIDETADQGWPSKLSSLQAGPHTGLIKICGLMKPLGLNGLRLAAVPHSASLRPAFQEMIWLAGAALEVSPGLRL